MSKPPILLTILLAAAGCGTDDGGNDPLPPLDQLPWPSVEAVPTCTPFAESFALPALAAPTGRVRVDDPVALHPAGAVTTLELIALDAAGAPDAAAAGAVTLELGAGATVLEVAPMVAGRTSARVRFDQAGTFTATATLVADGRSGTTALVAYASQLPRWELTIDPGDLAALEATPFADVRVPGMLAVDGVAFATTVRLHGGTSRDFAKKSFRFDLGPGLELDGHDHLVLRAEWADKTMLRNWLALELVRNTTWLAAPAAELVHLRINDRFYGVMNHVERVDRDFLRARGLSPDGSLYEADPPLGAPPGDLTPLAPADYPVVYPQQAGTAAHADLRALIEDVLRRGPADFDATVLDEIAVDDVLVYLAALAVIQSQDHVRKNYYLYRDPAAAPGWRVVPWDLDLTFGHLWTEANDVLDEAITVDGDPFVGAVAEGRVGPYNALIDRLLAIPVLRERMVAMIDRIADAAVTGGLVDDRLSWAVCHAMPELLADPRQRAARAEYLGRVDEIRGFTSARRAFLAGLP